MIITQNRLNRNKISQRQYDHHFKRPHQFDQMGRNQFFFFTDVILGGIMFIKLIGHLKNNFLVS